MANSTHQNKRKFHTVYQTTNLINNKIYIGAHSTDEIYDEYCGSGTNINRAIEKYGRAYFRKDLLHVFNTPEEMFAKEKEIVTPEFLLRDDVYNIVEGGYGGYNKGSTGLKHLHHPISGERCAVHPNAVSKMLQEGWVTGRLSSSTKDKIWVHCDLKKKMINPADLQSYLNNGWTQGLPKSPTKGKTWIYHAETNQYSLCDSTDLQHKLSDGWIKQKWSPVKKGSVWVNDGNTNYRVSNIEIDTYIANGWQKGLLTTRW